MHNYNQKLAIENTEGPLLVIAGPGTGKTYTIVEKVIYMVEKKGIDPSEILISTFTNKASFELIDRLSIEFKKRNMNKDVNDMLIGNFHSICNKILNENIDYTPLRRGFLQIDEVEQSYLIYRYLKKFREIEGYYDLVDSVSEEKSIVKIVNKVSEYGILNRDRYDNFCKENTIIDIVSLYEKILFKHNFVDFSHILLYTLKLLEDNRSIREKLQKRINYILIDEYQDTNVVQDKIIMNLLNSNCNICVVGDDDQSLYRFRGSSVRNILEFNKKFDNLKIVKLQQNYRSEDSIIRFYSNYINNLINENPSLKKYRYSKVLYSDKTSEDNRVCKLYSEDEEDWKFKIYTTINNLKRRGCISSYNEVAILFSSINVNAAKDLKKYLENRDIGVYLPKTNTLLSNDEIKVLIGFVYAVFENYINDEFKEKYVDNFSFLLNTKDIYLKKSDFLMKDFVERMKKYLSDDFNLNLFDLYYRAFSYKPFFDYMQDEIKAKRISRYLEVINKFCLINQIFYINNGNINKFVKLFFFNYIKFLRMQKISEFDEEVEIPDENSISMLTIHASKGMEYPVVIMASLWDKEFKVYRKKIDNILDDFLIKNNIDIDFEPIELIGKLDFYRRYYVGFSRAKDLLILAARDLKSQKISNDFSNILSDLEEFNIDKLNLKSQNFKNVKVKKKYSYTRDIVLYKNNPIEYYYFRKLKFTLPNTKELFYGSLVHESIEYINKCIINNEKLEEIEKIIKMIAIEKRSQGAVFLNREDIRKAVEEVNLYLDNLEIFGIPIESELGITLAGSDYILTGNVDMICKKDDEYNIVDFKTGNPPKIGEKSDKLEEYFNQINLYAYLYNKTKNMKISNMIIYFTDLDAQQRIFKFSFDEDKNKKVLCLIDEIIRDIESNNFKSNNKNSRTLLKYFINALQTSRK